MQGRVQGQGQGQEVQEVQVQVQVLVDWEEDGPEGRGQMVPVPQVG